jgi:hypothetical protein
VLANLGHEVARDTVADLLKEHGLEPAPERERTTWKDFLCRHRDVKWLRISSPPSPGRARV